MGMKSRIKKERRVKRERLERLMEVTPGRKCGDCSECCTNLGVHEINTQGHQPCPYQCGSGCSIYKERPLDCRTFSCFWLEGAFADDHRPDKIGTVIHGSTDETRKIFGPTHALVDTSITKEQIFSTGARKMVLDLILESGNSAVVTGPGWGTIVKAG